MADYVPLFTPGQDFTSQASAAITGGQILAVSGSGTVAPAGANAKNWVGVATQDASNGDKVGVTSGGVQRLTASGAVTAGDLVVCAAAGQVSTLAAAAATAAASAQTQTDIENTRAIVGLALTTAANGALVEIKMER